MTVDYQKRVAEGVCTKCGFEKPRQGYRMCMYCSKREVVMRSRMRREMKQNGKCVSCFRADKPIVAGGRCEECRVKNNATAARWRAKRKAKQND